MKTLVAEPITAAAFGPYGDVLEAPTGFSRTYFDAGLANLRPEAGGSLSVTRIAPTPEVPFVAVQMERHEFSSQSFVPIDVSRYIVVVAPHAADGGPDAEAARAFLVPGDVGITYHVDIWHHPMTILDRPARFAVFMWRDGSSGDEEFVQLAHPFRVALAEA
jgi:ureidoglycolate lyase